MANARMEHVHEDDRIVVRLDPGDEVMDSLETLRDEYDIENGFLAGIGAVDRATLGHYDVETQEYSEEEFTGQFEVTSFLGNIGPDKIHTHIQLGTDTFESLGGHCSGARVSGTFEILVTLGETPLTHRLDDRTGLDVFDI
nr:PPC domain-containing DNA-binding protein [Haladaptatus halobius]